MLKRLNGWLLACLALIAVASTACTVKKAQASPPKSDVAVAYTAAGDIQYTIPCEGPATMAGCLVTAYDSTASAVLVASTARAKGQSLVVTRVCSKTAPTPPVVVGVTRIGTAPGFTPSTPRLDRIQADCPALQAPQPTGTITVEITT